MRITEKHLRDFFPMSMRFTHYVAKYYGYTFHNSETVERATFIAKKAILKWYNEGKEFESNEHLYGMVMSRFRYAILNSYKGNANEQNLNVRPASDFIFGDSKDDEYNTVDYYMPKEKNKYEDNIDDFYEMLKAMMSPIELKVLELRYKRDRTYPEIATDTELTTNQVRAILHRIRTKYKKLKNRIKLQEYEYSLENKNAFKVVQETNRRIQEQVRLESLRADQEARDRYNEAMSWLHSNE